MHFRKNNSPSTGTEGHQKDLSHGDLSNGNQSSKTHNLNELQLNKIKIKTSSLVKNIQKKDVVSEGLSSHLLSPPKSSGSKFAKKFDFSSPRNSQGSIPLSPKQNR